MPHDTFTVYVRMSYPVYSVGVCDNRNNIIRIFHDIFTKLRIMIFDIIAITVKPQNGNIILRTYVGAVFFTASLWLGNYMGKSKGTRSTYVYSFCSWTLPIPFTIFVAIIVITNRETSYYDNRENIAINDIIEISHRPT